MFNFFCTLNSVFRMTNAAFFRCFSLFTLIVTVPFGFIVVFVLATYAALLLLPFAKKFQTLRRAKLWQFLSGARRP